MLLLGGKAKTLKEGAAKITASLQDGSALRKFAQIVTAQGGDARAVTEVGRLPQAPDRSVFKAPRKGFITVMDAEAIGLAAMDLGAGRARSEDQVDPAVGLKLLHKVGAKVSAGEPLVEIHHRSGKGLESCLARLHGAYGLGAQKPRALPLIAERMGARG